MGGSSESTLSKSIKFGCIITFIVVILGALGRFILDSDDRNRCSSLLGQGNWIDDSYKQWQPSNCMMHTYKATEISTCLNHSRILFIGDSITRQQFLATVQIIDPETSLEGEGHVNRKYIFSEHHIELEFWWDPYLNTSMTNQLLSSQSTVIKPSLLIIGTGAWQMHYLGKDYFNQWKLVIDNLFQSISKSNEIADALLLGPVEIPDYSKLSKIRNNTMIIEKVNRMNQYLNQKEKELKVMKTPMGIPFVWNEISRKSNNLTQDGLHFNLPVTSIQSQIALNFRCNNQLDKKFPMDTTCCYSYNSLRWYQIIIFIFFLIFIPISFYFVQIGYKNNVLYNESTLNGLFIFGLCITYMYLSDRTQLFGKIHKHFDTYTFTGLMIFTTLLGLIKLENKVELEFLNRYQTNEWKGWMQIIILIYHFCGASSISGIYNPVRILVAAYLFQTGYGHFFYFYKKQDFSFGRILNVIIRLNFLTFILQYFMDTNYISYYFTPLVSFWFLIIWIIMYVGNKWNKLTTFMLLKLFISCILTTLFIKLPGILEFIFKLLKTCFNIQWDVNEWRFRLSLDCYIIYIGMLSAYLFIKMTEYNYIQYKNWYFIKYTSILLSIIGIIWYFWFELTRESKFIYNQYHPYISWIPILSFIIIRNSTNYLRNTHSTFFAFIGKISLETFIGQFHMWLAADTKGLLIVIPFINDFYLWWWINLIISTCLFIFICYYTSQTTQQVTNSICKSLLDKPTATTTNAQGTGGGDYQPVPLLPTGSPTASTNEQDLQEEIWDNSTIEKKSNRLSCFLNDTRIKSILFIIIVGLLNNLC